VYSGYNIKNKIASPLLNSHFQGEWYEILPRKLGAYFKRFSFRREQKNYVVRINLILVIIFGILFKVASSISINYFSFKLNPRKKKCLVLNYKSI